MYIITIRGYIGFSDNATPKFLGEELQKANGDDVQILFSSGGGLVYPGLEMANMIRNYSGKITAKINGLAASMASYIPMMCDEVIAEDNAVFMIHNVFGFAMGDFRDVEKSAKHLRGLRDLLAKAYTNKTGKGLEEIQGLMNDETYYYGDEMEAAGFADRMIESDSDSDDDKDSALTKARVNINSCISMMKENETQVADDFKKAAAYLSSDSFNVEPKGSTKGSKTPSAEGNKKKEANMKTLKEFLAATPDAQADFDAAIKAARSEGEVTGKADMRKSITAVAPYLKSEKYPAVVGETALNVLTGESSMVELKAAVAAVDAVTQQQEEAAAKLENGEETPPGSPEAQSEDGTVKDASQLASATAQFKNDFGSGASAGGDK